MRISKQPCHWYVYLVAIFGSLTAHAENFVTPASGTLYISCVGGSAGAVSQFGIGTSIANFVPYLNSLPGSCPTTEVSVGSVTAGQTVQFGIHTLWGGQDYWAFSDGTDEASVVAFGGNNVQPTGPNTWVMHLNDAAHYTVSTDEANNILIQLRLAATGPAPPKIGGGTCSNSTVNGTYFYLLSGSVASGGQVGPYSELGKLVADGQGGVQGSSYGSVIGQQYTYSLSGTYSIQPSCAGTMTLTVHSQTSTSNSTTTSTYQNTLAFQVVNNGLGMTLAIYTSSAVVAGEADRQTASATPIQCGTGSLSGGYGYVLAGGTAVSGGTSVYSDAGQITSDGNGNLSGASLANLGGTVSQVTGSGTYTIGSDCSGTANLIGSQNTSANYRFALVRDGQVALFFGSDPGRIVSGVFTPQFAPPQQSVVNGASFRSQMVSPGSLFSIFGTGLSAQSMSAGTVPLPNSLGETQVLVNGTPAPLLYVGDNQVNAQMPIDAAPGQAVTFTVMNGGTPSNSVTLTMPSAAPGFFTSNGKEAIVQNPNGSMNSAAAPAHPGDVLVAYLTGGGAVNAAGPWITGVDSPAGASSVRAPYSLTVGGLAADVQYVGLAPGFVGLYQANFTLPLLSAGSYSMVLMVGGVSSNAASVVVGG
jgi:uncharacterized protein (TIGR03437 family)